MSGAERIDVAIVEDNAVFREALEVILGMTPDLNVVLSVPDAATAIERCPALRPQVALVDYRLPDLDGVRTTRALRSECPGIAVVALTAGAREPELEALRGAGVFACLTKTQGLEEITSTIRRAARSGAGGG